MGRNPEADGLKALRRDGGDNGSPLNEQERTIQDIGGSLYLNLSAFARDCHGISKGDDVSVQTYPNGVWIGVDNG